MTTVTPAWTDLTVRLMACVVALLGVGVLAGADSPVAAALYALAAFACTMVGVRFDAFIGLSVGLVGAAGVVGGRMLTDQWDSVSPMLAVAQSVALVTVGWLSGSLGGRMRAMAAAWANESSRSIVAVYNSLGLVHVDQAAGRLDEEIARSRRSHTPLALLLVRVDVDESQMSTQTRMALRRAVARLVEAGVGQYDVPFAVSESEIGAILPGTSQDQAWRTVVPLVEQLTQVTFADRETGERRSAVDCGRIRTGLAFADDSSSAEALMTRARAALDGSMVTPS